MKQYNIINFLSAFFLRMVKKSFLMVAFKGLTGIFFKIEHNTIIERIRDRERRVLK